MLLLLLLAGSRGARAQNPTDQDTGAAQNQQGQYPPSQYPSPNQYPQNQYPPACVQDPQSQECQQALQMQQQQQQQQQPGQPPRIQVDENQQQQQEQQQNPQNPQYPRQPAPGQEKNGQQGQQQRRTPPFPRPQRPPLTDFQKLVQSSLGKVLPIYGENLFDHVPTTFAPVDRIPVTADYVIGPGDELLIRAWGQIDLDVHARVDRNGEIYVPKVGNLSCRRAEVRSGQELPEIAHRPHLPELRPGRHPWASCARSTFSWLDRRGIRDATPSAP